MDRENLTPEAEAKYKELLREIMADDELCKRMEFFNRLDWEKRADYFHTGASAAAGKKAP